MGDDALVLSGGGAKGCFQLGAAWYLYRAARLRPTLISGTSVGAVNGLKLAEGGYTDPGDVLPDDAPLAYGDGGSRGIIGLWQLWRSMRSEPDMYGDSAAYLAIHDSTSDVDAALSTGIGPAPAALGLAVGLSWVPILGQALSMTVISEVKATLTNIRNLLAADAMFNLDPIGNRIVGEAPTVDMRLINDSGVNLYVACVGADTGALRYVHLLPDEAITANSNRVGELFNADMEALADDPVPFWQAVLGSSAIPSIFQPPTVADEKQFDGGVRNIVPMRPALARKSERIFALVCPAPENPRSLSAPNPNRPTPPAPVGDGIDASSSPILNSAERALDLITDQVVKWEMKPQPDWPDSVYEIRPEIDVLSTADIDPGQIAIAATYGYDLAFDLIDPRVRSNTARQYLRDLDTETAWLRLHAWRMQREQRNSIVFRVAKTLRSVSDPVSVFTDLVDDPASVNPAVLAMEEAMSEVPAPGLSEGCGLAAASAVYRQLWPHSVHPLPSALPLPDAGWTTPAEVRPPDHSNVDGLEKLLYSRSNQGIQALNAKSLVPTTVVPTPPPGDVWNRTTTWRNGTGAFRHTTWGILSEEFGRAPAAFRGYRPDATYVPGDPGANGNIFGPISQGGACVHFGQRLDLLNWSDQAITLVHRATSSTAADPWETEGVYIADQGNTVVSASLIQEPSGAPGLLTVAATLGLPSGSTVQLLHQAASRGPWVAGQRFPATGDASLLLQDTVGSCRSVLLVPNGNQLDLYSRQFGTFSSSTAAPNFDVAEWLGAGSITLVDHVPGTTAESVVLGVAACQTNFTSVAANHAGDLVLAIRYRPVGGTDATQDSVAILVGDIEQGLNGGQMTMTDGSAPTGVTATPAILQLSNGAVSILIADQSAVTEYRSTALAPTGWERVGLVHSGNFHTDQFLGGGGSGLPPKIHFPSAATVLGLTQADDGSPGAVLAYLRVVAATGTTHIVKRSLSLDGTWTQDPPLRHLELVDIN